MGERRPTVSLVRPDHTASLFVLIFGMFSVLYGVLLVPVGFGLLPYDGDKAKALFVLLFALLLAFQGITPVGTVRQTWYSFCIGLIAALFGALACFIPEWFGAAASIFLGLMLVSMGLVRFPVVLASRGRELAQLPASYRVLFYLMHIFCTVLGIGLLVPNTFSSFVSAMLMAGLGFVQVGLAFSSYKLEEENGPLPPTVSPTFGKSNGGAGSAVLPLRSMLLLLLAFVLILMVPVAFFAAVGVLPFESSGANSIFMFITALQVILVGDTPVKTVVPTWPVILMGLVLAALAEIAVIVPGVLDNSLGIIVGIANLLTAVFGSVRMAGLLWSPVRRRGPFVKDTAITGICLYILLVVFAVNLLVPDVVPGLLLLVVLVAVGALMIRLVIVTNKLR